MGVVKSVARGIGDILTGGAITARRAAKKAKKAEAEAREELRRQAEEERRKRRDIQRATLQAQPSLFDLLSGPGG